MRVAFISTLLLATLLAGCSDSQPAPPIDTICDDCGKVTPTTGVIRGVVVDQGILPVAGATVTLTGPTPGEATTDETGVFFFEALEPGTYFVDVAKPGYSGVQQSASVEAGVEPDVLRIQIQFIPGAQPYYEVLPFKGYLQCNAVAVFFFFPCDVPIVGSVGDDNYLNTWQLENEADHMQVVLTWEPTQMFGTELYLNLFEPDAYDIVAWDGGINPVVVDANATTIAPLNAAKQFSVEVSGNGESALGGMAGVSIAQDFEVFVVVFYNFTPEEGYNYYTDGNPTIPS